VSIDTHRVNAGQPIIGVSVGNGSLW